MLMKATIATTLLAAAAASVGSVALLVQEAGGGIILGPSTLIPAGVVVGLFVLAVTASWKASRFVEHIVSRLDELHARLDVLEEKIQ